LIAKDVMEMFFLQAFSVAYN